MVCIIQCDKALGVFGGGENLGRVGNVDNLIAGGVQDQEGAFHARNNRPQSFRLNVLYKFPPKCDGTTAKHHLRFAFGDDFIQGIAKVMGHVAGIKRCPNGGDGTNRGNFGRGAQDGGTTQRMANQQTGGHAARVKIGRRRLEVGHI